MDLDPFVGVLDYPMFVVTARVDDRRAGCLVGFTTQASIDPPRFLVCLSKANRTTRLAATTDVLAVHQLAATQVDLARRFGEHTGDTEDKFADGDGFTEGQGWHDGPHGLPILDGCPAWLAGRVLDRVDLGDHVGVLLEPFEVHGSGKPVLLMFRDLPPMDPGHPA